MANELMAGENVLLSQGINLKEIIASGGNFEIDVKSSDKSRNLDPYLADEHMFVNLDEEDNSDSDCEEALKCIESSAQKHAFSEPAKRSFTDLAAKMIDLLPSGDVKILILEEGDGPLVPLDAQVSLHYSAYWEKEEVPFDTTLNRNRGNPERHRLGAGALLPGLELALTAVRGPSARFELLLAPRAAWGGACPPRIRNETALFRVTLLHVQDVGAVYSFNSLPASEQKKFEVTIKTVTASNALAKDYFNRKKYDKAVQSYHKSLSVLQLTETQNDEEMDQIKALMAQVYMNLAVCYSKLDCPSKVLKMCNDLGNVTDIRKHCKGLFYYGKAFLSLGQTDDAREYLIKAQKVEPKNTEIAQMLSDLNKKILAAKKNEKEMWRQAFNCDAPVEVEFDIDEELKQELKETVESLAEHSGYVKFPLPSSMPHSEVEYVKYLIKDFDKLRFDENVVGNEKKLSIIKKC